MLYMPKKSRRKKSQQQRRATKQLSVLWRFVLIVFSFSLLIMFGWMTYLDAKVRLHFEGDKWALPARVFAQAQELYVGLPLSAKQLIKVLNELGYQQTNSALKPGQYSHRNRHFKRASDQFEIVTRGFHFWDGYQAPTRITLEINDTHISTFSNPEQHAIFRLEPQEIGSIYPSHGEDRIYTALKDIPPLLGQALMAVEDKAFAHHHGISIKSIARALVVNVKHGKIVQGGSTITQQLVKNFYLHDRRNLWRKIQEVLMAMIIELRYSKADILEAYINEIYLGQSGARSIHGFGLASQHYFLKDVNQLKAHEIALLVALVKGASYYNPWRHPERALQRRDIILEILFINGLIDKPTYTLSLNKPLGVTQYSQRQQGDYPAFLQLVKEQLLQDYRLESIQSQGLRIFSTLSLPVQHATEAAVIRNMKAINQTSTLELEAAAIVTAIGSGEIVALVGGKQPRFSGFNRALGASRQIGSLIKPFIYLSALQNPNRYSLTTPIEDSTINLKLPNGDVWQPTNFDKKNHGTVPLYQALAFSYNLATVRLGLDIGVVSVIDTLKQSGLKRSPAPLPSLLLGALDMTPLEVSHLYHTLAADGVYTPLRAIRAVKTDENKTLKRYELQSEARFALQHSHLMHYALQSVMRIGTGKNAYQSLEQKFNVAGKTGTSDSQRDNWFAGYSGDHLGVIWVGHDNNQATQLTGSQAALPIWVDIFQNIQTRGVSQTTPSTVSYYWVNPEDNATTNKRCRNATLVPYLKGHEPKKHKRCK